MIDIIYQHPILSISIATIILSFTLIGYGIAKRKRIKAIKKLLEECQNFGSTNEALRVSLIKLREQIRFCPYISYKELGILDTWIPNYIHDIDLRYAKEALKTFEDNPIMHNYNVFQTYINRGILFSELKVTRQLMEKLKRQAQIQDGLSRLGENKREREKIMEGLEDQGITEKDLYPAGDLG